VLTFDFSRRVRPLDNVSIESFNSRLREECLNAPCILFPDDARTKIEGWRKFCNGGQSHSSQGDRTPR